jgi:hypothetical protein
VHISGKCAHHGHRSTTIDKHLSENAACSRDPCCNSPSESEKLRHVNRRYVNKNEKAGTLDGSCDDSINFTIFNRPSRLLIVFRASSVEKKYTHMSSTTTSHSEAPLRFCLGESIAIFHIHNKSLPPFLARYHSHSSRPCANPAITIYCSAIHRPQSSSPSSTLKAHSSSS